MRSIREYRFAGEEGEDCGEFFLELRFFAFVGARKVLPSGLDG